MTKKNEINGILLVNKPKGLTSFDVCDLIKKHFKFKKVGHSGTLDPVAEGLLVIGINKATRILRFLYKKEKEYVLSIDWGKETDTWDLEGRILNQKKCKPTKEKIKKAFEELIGEKKLPIPYYSAKKINGKKMYEMARKNKFVDLEKLMYFKSIEFVDDEYIKVVCSEGTYIRSFVYVLGKILNCPATMKSLKRTKNNNFSLKDAIELENLLKKNEINDIIKNYNDALSHLKPIMLDRATYEDIVLNNYFNLYLANEGTYRLLYRGKIIGIYTTDKKGFKIIKLPDT